MKKQMFVIWVVLFVLLPIFGACGQEGLTGPGGGFTGPGSNPNTTTVITVAAAQSLRDDARVTLQGTIVSQLSREKYNFRDSTGEIVVEIDRRVWGSLTISETDLVEIYGEIDRERRGTEIDVKRIRKL